MLLGRQCFQLLLGESMQTLMASRVAVANSVDEVVLHTDLAGNTLLVFVDGKAMAVYSAVAQLALQ